MHAQGSCSQSMPEWRRLPQSTLGRADEALRHTEHPQHACYLNPTPAPPMPMPITPSPPPTYHTSDVARPVWWVAGGMCARPDAREESMRPSPTSIRSCPHAPPQPLPLLPTHLPLILPIREVPLVGQRHHTVVARPRHDWLLRLWRGVKEQEETPLTMIASTGSSC